MPTILPKFEEYITIGGLVMATPAVRCVDWSELWGEPDVYGDDVRLLGGTGVEPRGRKAGPLLALLRVDVHGEKDEDGNVNADPKVGVRTNLNLVKTITKPTVTTRTLRLTYRDATFDEVDCQVLGPLRPQWETPTLVRVVLRVQLPDGPIT